MASFDLRSSIRHAARRWIDRLSAVAPRFARRGCGAEMPTASRAYSRSAGREGWRIGEDGRIEIAALIARQNDARRDGRA